jgi:hypothetical protein
VVMAATCAEKSTRRFELNDAPKARGPGPQLPRKRHKPSGEWRTTLGGE